MKINILFITLMYVLISCNTHNKQYGEFKAHNFRVEELVSNLNYALSHQNKDSIRVIWNSILDDEKEVVDYLLSPESNIGNDFFWIDTLPKRTRNRSFSEVGNEISKLHLICAIYYKDLYFAFDRKIYDDQKIDKIPYNKDMNWFDKVSNSMKAINYDSIWASVREWAVSNKKQRPFYKTNYFWLGENNGKLTFDNCYQYYIH